MKTRARIVTVCQGRRWFPTIEENREHVLALLDLALAQRPDLVCLPETFTQPMAPYDSVAEIAEPLDGPTVAAAAQRARKHGCYVVCPLFCRRDEGCFNAAVILGRDGSLVGVYDKRRPVTSSADYTVFENGVTPGGPVPVFDLDFGRIGIQICFDLGFPEQWQRLADQGAKLVLWPSAYNGGFPLQVFAALHRYYVVSAVKTDSARIIDPCGTILAHTDRLVQIAVREINLDFAVCHSDFNYSIPDRILAAYPGRVEIRSHPDDGIFLVEPTDPSVTIAQLRGEFGFETAATYFERHRAGQREPKAPQAAAHGDRPMYQKW